MFNPSREQVRNFFCGAWRKHRERSILEGAEATAVDLILRHPEYHALLENPEAALDREFTPEGGESNPFLHLSLHLAIAEQTGIDQPPGIRAAFDKLRGRLDEHAAEHALLECLGETIWRAQRTGGAMDAELYLDCLKRVARA
ncbi:MAG: DUF1841 family protein [Betaproteobacteria bacterium]|nr:DUF1841 family protein [Betaproteobacteria bacterium]